MSLLVQKFGGTSVGSVERIEAVADKLVKFHQQGHQLVVVVSAMSGETNRLIALAKAITDSPINASWTCWCPPASRSPSVCWRWH